MQYVILIDMDNVLADFDKAFIFEYYRKFPKRSIVPISMRENYYIKDDYPKKFHNDIESIYNESGFYKKLEPIEGAIEAFIDISKIFNTYICTSPLQTNPTCIEDKTWWIRNYLGNNFIKKTIISHDKTLINGDILIDDNPKINGVILFPKWKQLIFERAYNKNIDKAKINWNNYQEILEKEIKKKEQMYLNFSYNNTP